MIQITENPLTAKQQRFTEEYVVDLNATQAAIRAGYSMNSANVIGCENLTKPKIKAEIKRLQIAIRAKTGRTIAEVDYMYQHAYDLAEQRDDPNTNSMNGSALGIARLHGFDKDAGGKESTIIIINPPSNTKKTDCEVIENEE